MGGEREKFEISWFEQLKKSDDGRLGGDFSFAVTIYARLHGFRSLPQSDGEFCSF
jgi:hypothetical protein